ncbi:MAG: S41 family peptidase [Prolixibacteraceae bacterium]|nr:S41 family peptidase [Prolixibacteraceae bacterium]MBN2648233.1 S41 family peptidase [Prolixibacteraceae bacterium]
MRTFSSIIIFIIALLLFSSCEKTILEMPSKSNTHVFEAFWKGIDERYAYFELKNINWDSLHTHYGDIITNEMTDEALFDTLSVLIDLLHDGHSGIKSSFDMHKNTGFYMCGPENVSERLIVDNYSKGWGMQIGNLRHFALCNNDIAYIYYGNFSDLVSDYDIDYLVNKYKNTKGIIFDIRSNYGGSAENIFRLTKRFAQDKTHLYNNRFKNGPGHADFSDFTETCIEPAQTTYKGKVCVLTNRKVYSAASIFTLSMKQLPSVTIVGDTTGGGLGMPVGFELPNEWQVYCAGTQIISVDGENLELGVPPDVQVNMTDDDIANGIDTIIEKAIEIINEQSE